MSEEHRVDEDRTFDEQTILNGTKTYGNPFVVSALTKKGSATSTIINGPCKENIIFQGQGGRFSPMESLEGCPLLGVVFELFAHADLLGVACASRALRDEALSERHWHRLSRYRWGVTKGQPKAFGGATWLQAYRMMATAQRLPRSTSYRGERIFARGRRRAVADAWVGIAHTPNCRLALAPNDPTAWAPASAGQGTGRTIDLRVVVQSTRLSGMLAPDATAAVLRLRGPMGAVLQLPCTSPRLLGLNGARVPHRCLLASNYPEDSVVLAPLMTAVFGVAFLCPADVVVEPDFLCRAMRLDIPCCLVDGRSAAAAVCVEAEFVGEAVALEHYELIDRNFLVLVERDRLLHGKKSAAHE